MTMDVCFASDLERKAREVCRLARARHPDVVIGDLPWGVVQGLPCLFYPRALRNGAPEAVATLIAIADDHGFVAAVDRRERDVPVCHDRRRRLALVIGLGASLLARAPAHAAGIETAAPATVAEVAVGAQATTHSELVALRSPDGRLSLSTRALPAERIEPHLTGLAECGSPGRSDDTPCIATADAAAREIEHFFHTRLAEGDRTAEHLVALSNVARYYSQFPAVRRVVTSLASFDVELRAVDGRWETRAELRGDTVTAVRVHFDLAAAARMHFYAGCEDQPACTASPADALLHELVHAYLMFHQGGAFAESVRATGYPHAHEREVIALERQLYAAMSRQDGLPRPSRFRHLAELVTVDCPVCWAAR